MTFRAAKSWITMLIVYLFGLVLLSQGYLTSFRQTVEKAVTDATRK